MKLISNILKIYMPMVISRVIKRIYVLQFFPSFSREFSQEGT